MAREGYLLLEQWQRPPEREYLAAAPSEWWPWTWHFLDDDERGGLPAEMVAEGEAAATWESSSEDPCFPLDMLPSPVMEDMKDEFAEDMEGVMLKLSLLKRLETDVSPHRKPVVFIPGVGFVKSSVRDCG